MTSPGQPIDGKYEILAKLKEGGMGAIFVVRHRLLNELRVIKVMRPQIAESEDDRRRFVREAQTATRLKHPNIATFHDFVIDDDGSAFMVMEYIEGINLRDLIRSYGPPPVVLAVEFARQSLEAIGYLHRRGIVHRDLSPDNLMMTRDDAQHPVIKLIDLGIAKNVDANEELTATGVFVGKLRYCSPEQLKTGVASNAIDTRSDLYSFGVVLYELLTGKSPFPGEGMQQLLVQRLERPPLLFEETDKGGRIPNSLREVVRRALEPEPVRRFQTAEEFAAAVEEAAGGELSRTARQEIERYVAPAYRAIEERSFASSPGTTAQREINERFATPLPKQISGKKKPITGPTVSLRELKERSATNDEPTHRTPSGERRHLSALAGPTVVEEASFREPTGPRESSSRGMAATSSRRERDEEDAEEWSVAREGTRSRATSAAAVDRAPPSLPWIPIAAGGALLLLAAAAALILFRPSARRAEDTAERPTPAALAPTAAAPAPTLAPIAVAASAPTAVPTAALLADASRPAALPTRAVPSPPMPAFPTAPPARGGVKVADASGAKVARIRLDATPVTSVAVQSLPAGASDPPVQASAMRYCSSVAPKERSSFVQGTVREKPAGFASDSKEYYEAPRPDAGRIGIDIAVEPKEPMEGQPFVITFRLVNGGDSDLMIKLVEESSMRDASGFTPLKERVPTRVDMGSSPVLFEYRSTLSGGGQFFKELRFTDANGDTWMRSVRIRPC